MSQRKSSFDRLSYSYTGPNALGIEVDLEQAEVATVSLTRCWRLLGLGQIKRRSEVGAEGSQQIAAFDNNQGRGHVLGSITSEKSCYRKLAADEWFKENDLEGAAFEYEVLDGSPAETLTASQKPKLTTSGNAPPAVSASTCAI